MWRKRQVSPAKRFKRMQILYQTSPLSGVRAAVWAQEVETSPSVGTQKRRAVLLEKKYRLFQALQSIRPTVVPPQVLQPQPESFSPNTRVVMPQHLSRSAPTPESTRPSAVATNTF